MMKSIKSKLNSEEVQKFCQVNPIGMIDGSNYCPHGNDCINCQYLLSKKYTESLKNMEGQYEN